MMEWHDIKEVVHERSGLGDATHMHYIAVYKETNITESACELIQLIHRRISLCLVLYK